MALNILVTFLGIIFTILAKMNSLKKDFEVANQEFVVKKYFQRDWMAIAMSFVSATILFAAFPEISTNKPWLGNWQVVYHAVAGALGTYLFNILLGGSKKYIRGVIDTKTDIADGKIQPNE